MSNSLQPSKRNDKSPVKIPLSLVEKSDGVAIPLDSIENKGAVIPLDLIEPESEASSQASTDSASFRKEGGAVSFPGSQFMGFTPIVAGTQMTPTRPEEPSTAARATAIAMYNFANTSSFGIPEMVMTKEGRQFLAPRNTVEKIASKIGSLGGYIGAVRAVGAPLTEALLGKAGFRKALNFLVDKFGTKVGLAIVNGLPLAVTNALQNDESMRRVLKNPSVENVFKNFESRLLGAIEGEALGARYSYIAQTLKSWGGRAIANTIMTNLTYAIKQVATGHSDVMPPIEDIVYNTLLDVWFSKNPEKPADDVLEQMRNAAKVVAQLVGQKSMKDIERAVVNNPDMLHKAAVDAVAKFEAEKELGLAKSTAEKQRPSNENEPVVLLDHREIDALADAHLRNGLPLDEPIPLPNNVVIDEGYYKLTKIIDTYEQNKDALDKGSKQLLITMKRIKQVIDKNAAMGDRGAGELANVLIQVVNNAEEGPRSAELAVRVLDAYAKALGAKPGELLQEVGFKIERATPEEEARRAKTEKGVPAAVAVTDVDKGKVSIRTFTPMRSPIVYHELLHTMINGVFYRAVKERLIAKGASPEAISKMKNVIDMFFARYPDTQINAEENLADYFIKYIRDNGKDIPAFEDVPKVVISEFRKAYKEMQSEFTDMRTDFKEDMSAIARMFLGDKVVKSLNAQARERMRILGKERTEQDPAVYVNEVPGIWKGTKIVNLIRDIKLRGKYIQSLHAKLNANEDNVQVRREINRLMKLQDRDVSAINLLSEHEFMYDLAHNDVVPVTRNEGRMTEVSAIATTMKQQAQDPLSTKAADLLLQISSGNWDNALYAVANDLRGLYYAGLRDGKVGISRDLLGRYIRALPDAGPEIQYIKGFVDAVLSRSTDLAEGNLEMLTSALAKRVNDAKAQEPEMSPWLEEYLDKQAKAANEISDGVLSGIIVKPAPRDISPVWEWIVTPQYALRKFPEARGVANDLINARMAHLYSVGIDEAVFKDALKGISSKDYPLVRKAIQMAYDKEVTQHEIEQMFGERIARAGIMIKNWFITKRDAVREHLMEVAKRELPEVVVNFADGIKSMDKSEALEVVTKAVDEGKLSEAESKQVLRLWNKLKQASNWGIWDYVTNIELGTYKVKDKNGHVVAVRTSLSEARRAAKELQSQGLVKGKLTIVNEESRVDPLEARGVVNLQGDPDLLKALRTYSYKVNKQLIVEPAVYEAGKRMALGGDEYFPKNVRHLLEGMIEQAMGKWYFEDYVMDYIARKLKLPTMTAGEVAGVIRKVQAAAKLGWRGGAVVVNVLNALTHIEAKTSLRYMARAVNMIAKGDADWLLEATRPFVEETMVQGEGNLGRRPLKVLHPLYGFSMSEKGVRDLSAVANYLYAIDHGYDKEGAVKFAIEATQTQMFLYDAVALPRLMRSPTGRLLFQFKAFLVQELQFVSQLTGSQFMKYLTAQFAIGGAQALLHFMHSIPMLDSIGLLDKIDDELQSMKIPDWVPVIGGKPAAYGIMGLLGVDITWAAAVQLPERVEDWVGPTVSTLIDLYKGVKEAMQIGVKDAVGLRKVTDSRSGLHLLLDKTAQEVVVARYWRDAFDALTAQRNGELWIRDSRGYPAFPVKGWWDFAKLAMGMRPLTSGIINNKLQAFRNAMERKIAKRRALVSTFVDIYLQGKKPKADLIQDLLTYGVSPSALQNALENTQLTPQQRLMRISALLDKMDAADVGMSTDELLRELGY